MSSLIQTSGDCDPLESTPMGGGERELLLGAVALHHRLIDETALAAAVEAWRSEPSRGLADHLVSHGALDGEGRRTSESLCRQHLERHGGNAARGLAALPIPG